MGHRDKTGSVELLRVDTLLAEMLLLAVPLFDLLYREDAVV